MSRTATYDAIVLRTIDVGEADRLCVFFTKEVGRIAARAHGARKTGSKSGGALLPFRHVAVDLYVTDSGATVRSVQEREDLEPPRDYRAFARLERGIELLLALTEDGHPLPDVFTLLRDYIRLPAQETGAAFHLFRLRLLHVLGLLPATDDDPRFRYLPEEGRAVVIACAAPTFDIAELCRMTINSSLLEDFIQSVTDSTLERPLRSDLVALDSRV